MYLHTLLSLPFSDCVSDIQLWFPVSQCRMKLMKKKVDRFKFSDEKKKPGNIRLKLNSRYLCFYLIAIDSEWGKKKLSDGKKWIEQKKSLKKRWS